MLVADMGEAQGELIERYGADEGIVGVGAAIGTGNGFGVLVDSSDVFGQVELIGADHIGHAEPDRPGAAMLGELEGAVWPPGYVFHFKQDVFGDALQVGNGYALADPGEVHLLSRIGPYFEVVRDHEHAGDARSKGGVDPFFEVGGVGIGGVFIFFDDALQALPHFFLRQVADVVLEGVGHKALPHPHPGFALVAEPAIGTKGLDHQVVEILVVGELHVAADVPGKAVVVHIAGGEAACFVFAVEDNEILNAEFF